MHWWIALAVFVVVGALWLGRAVIVPVTLAVVMATVLWPAVQLLRRLRVPSPLAATIVVATALAGATRGIGLATAAALAERGTRVMLVGRDRERLERAMALVASRAGEEAPPLT